MSETIARVNSSAGIDLVDERMRKIEGAASMTPLDAAWLARGLLACAATLTGQNTPTPGTIVGDAHLPIMRWATGTSKFNGKPVLILSVPPGFELTFEMTPAGAKELGAALVAFGEGRSPPEGHRGTIH